MMPGSRAAQPQELAVRLTHAEADRRPGQGPYLWTMSPTRATMVRVTAAAQKTTPEEFFAGHADALAAFRQVCAIVERHAPFEVRISKSQVAFRRKRGFAYLWLPGKYLRNPTADVVLSIALDRLDESPRFKEVAHPTPAHWMHHLELQSPSDLDDEVAGWLQEAADCAG